MIGLPAPAIITPRETWLAERRKGVGASDVAAILGVDPRRGALAVYAEKLADTPSERDEEYMAFGRDVEVAIAKGYSRKTGRDIFRACGFEIVRHPTLSILGATIDFEIYGSKATPAPAAGLGVLETKALGWMKRDEWLEAPPLMFVVQVQVQMACARVAWGSLGALIGGVVIADPIDLLPDADFMAAALPAIERFWWHVKHRIPPEADAKPETPGAIRRLWPGQKGTAYALDGDDLLLVQQWEDAKHDAEEAEDNCKRLVNRLAVRMGDAERGYLLDGSCFVYSVENVKAQVCGCGRELRAPHTRRVPRRWWPRHLRRGKRR